MGVPAAHRRWASVRPPFPVSGQGPAEQPSDDLGQVARLLEDGELSLGPGRLLGPRVSLILASMPESSTAQTIFSPKELKARWHASPLMVDSDRVRHGWMSWSSQTR